VQRFRLLRRIMRARRLAQVYGPPLCDRDRLKALTDGGLRAYFYNLGDRVKRHVMLHAGITRCAISVHFHQRWMRPALQSWYALW
jgi:hypothetical protein